MSDKSKALKIRLKSYGVVDKDAEDFCKNEDQVKNLYDVLDEAGLSKDDAPCSKKVIDMLKLLSIRIAPGPQTHEFTLKFRRTIVHYIVDGKINSTSQVEEAFKWARKNRDVDIKAFEQACGVGVVVTNEDIVNKVREIIKEHHQTLMDGQYSVVNNVYKHVRDALPWGDAKTMKNVYDAEILKLLGDKTAENSKPRKSAAKVVPDEKKPELVQMEKDDFLSGRDIPAAHNTKEQLEAHLKATGGLMVTRFPPEPNGFLHIGHAKSMHLNFGKAKERGGHTIMRFDDTNPEAEKKVYIDSILENLDWMGHKPVKVTYSSDYFGELYDLAVKLIKKGKAYICHQTAEEMAESKKSKEGRKESPWRNRPIEENLRLFDRMKRGLFAEGEATLRIKGDLTTSNPNLWDYVAYRIKYVAHPHAGSKWCIYPTYDYTHCINDSLENITHSMCTLEFETRRESYYWLLDELDLYKPKVWEYSRLNIEHNVLSKRRLLRLVNDKLVAGWDDPRLLSLNGLRRRGYTPEAITSFCESIGVSRNENCISNNLLEKAIRDDLNLKARRVFMVINPLKVIITNFDANKVSNIPRPNFSNDESRGFVDMPFSRVVYIEKDDFRADDKSKDYKGMTRDREVHLKYGHVIKCVKISKTDADGKPTEIEAEIVESKESDCKSHQHIHWVAQPKPGQEPLKVNLRLYEILFKSKEPMKVSKEEMASLGYTDWTDDLNPRSRVDVTAFAEPSVATVTPGDKLQAERLGYFCCDPDSSASKGLVFNRTCTLSEAKEKR